MHQRGKSLHKLICKYRERSLWKHKAFREIGGNITIAVAFAGQVNLTCRTDCDFFLCALAEHTKAANRHVGRLLNPATLDSMDPESRASIAAVVLRMESSLVSQIYLRWKSSWDSTFVSF